jgi:dephospho-CoA kinase
VISIGLTGGIASGKSQVGAFLAKRGACVVDADRVAHEAYAPGSEGFRALVEAFGSGITGSDGTIDRVRLGQVVFADPARRRQLTDIVWPLTRRLVEALQSEQRQAGTQVFVVEAPLLLEAGWRDLVDQVWLVRSPAESVRQRLRGRGLSDEEAERRLKAVTNLEALAEIADLIIENDGDLSQLAQRVEAALRSLPIGK